MKQIFKRALALGMVGIMVLALASCGNSQVEEPSESEDVENTSIVEEEDKGEVEATNGVEDEEPSESEDVGTNEGEDEGEDVVEEEEEVVETPSVTTTPEPTTTTTPSENKGNTNNNTTSTPTPTNTPEPPVHTHTWTTKEVYHEGTGHYETKEETQEVIVGYESTVLEYTCRVCGFTTTSYEEDMDHSFSRGHGSSIIRKSGGNPIYETHTTTTTYWVEDTPAWTEYITTCPCGATK